MSMKTRFTIDTKEYEFDDFSEEAKKMMNQTLSYIYFGEYVKTGQDVLLKRQNPQRAGALAEHFIRNAIACENEIQKYKEEKKLSGIEGFPHVLFAGDLGHNRGFGIVTTKVGDCDLEEKVKKDGILHIGKMLWLYEKLLGMSDVLNACNIVHADITPDNIRISDSLDDVFLVDLGLARRRDENIRMFFNDTPYVPECSIPPDKIGKYATAENIFMNAKWLLAGITKDTRAHQGIDSAMITNVLYYAVTGNIYNGDVGDDGSLDKKKVESGTKELFKQLPVSEEVKDEFLELLAEGFKQVQEPIGTVQLHKKVQELRKKLKEKGTEQKLDIFYDYKKDEKTYETSKISENDSYDQLERTLKLCVEVNKEVEPKPRAEKAMSSFNLKIREDYQKAEEVWNELLKQYKEGKTDNKEEQTCKIKECAETFNKLQQHLEEVNQLVAKKKDLFDLSTNLVERYLVLTKEKVNDVTILQPLLEFETGYQQNAEKLHTLRKKVDDTLNKAIDWYVNVKSLVVSADISNSITIPLATSLGVIVEFKKAKMLVHESEKQAICCANQVQNEKARIGKQTIYDEALNRIITEKLEKYEKDTFACYIPKDFLPKEQKTVADIENRCNQIVDEMNVLMGYILFEKGYKQQAKLLNEAQKDMLDKLNKVITLNGRLKDSFEKITSEIAVSPDDIDAVITEFQKAKNAIEYSDNLSANCKKLVVEKKAQIKQEISDSDIQKNITARLDLYEQNALTTIQLLDQFYQEMETSAKDKNILVIEIGQLTVLKDYVIFEAKYKDKKQAFDKKCAETKQYIQDTWKQITEIGTIDDKLKDAAGTITKIIATQTAVGDAIKVAIECNRWYNELVGEVDKKMEEMTVLSEDYFKIGYRIRQLKLGIEAAIKSIEYLPNFGLSQQIATLNHVQDSLFNEKKFFEFFEKAKKLRANYNQQSDVQRIDVLLSEYKSLNSAFAQVAPQTDNTAVAAVLSQKEAERQKYADNIQKTVTVLTAEREAIARYDEYAARENTVPVFLDGKMTNQPIPKTFRNRRTLTEATSHYRKYVEEIEIYRSIKLEGGDNECLGWYRIETDKLLTRAREQLRNLEETNWRWIRRRIFQAIGYTTGISIGAAGIWALLTYGARTQATTVDAGQAPAIIAVDAEYGTRKYDTGMLKPDTSKSEIKELTPLEPVELPIIAAPLAPPPKPAPPKTLPAPVPKPQLPASGYEWRTIYETKTGE